ncbi:MAG: hypothetical protein ACT4OZ_00090 [Gemmatimonadota bacterium]
MIWPGTARALLERAIDYAALFPPAELDLSVAAGNHLQYACGSDAWALGRFVVPRRMLAGIDHVPGVQSHQVRLDLSVLVGSGEDRDADLDAIALFNLDRPNGPRISAVEGRAVAEADMDDLARFAEAGLDTFVELAPHAGSAALVDSLARAGKGRMMAKLRTGGVTREAFPSAQQLVAFIRACHGAGARFKATAGLHHACAGTYALTYHEGSDRAPMFGYLNLMAAAILVRRDEPDDAIMSVLDPRTVPVVAMDDSRFVFGGLTFSVEEVKAMRSELLVSFGSCSFREPIDELAQLVKR